MYRLMTEVTNDSNTSRSSSLDNQSINGDEHHVQKRKPRRVRPLIKSPIEEMVDDCQSEQSNNTTNTKQNSTIPLVDKRPFPFGQCRVCVDKATGVHYGVPTCEGCKGFFKRSILRKEKYRCYFGDRCIITTDNRNRCKSCRFRKCLKEGMSVEGVRMGRIPKLVKEKALAEYHVSSSSSIENDDPSSSPTINANSFTLTDFNLELIDEQFILDDFNSISFDSSPETLPLCTTYVLPDNFTIDETQHDHEEDLFILNRSVLTNCTVNYEDQFSTNVIERIKKLVTKISHTIINTELGHEESSFIRYLRWKMIDLCNIYNERKRQLVDRMKIMIGLEIRDFPGDHSSLQDILEGLTDAIPFHVKNLITFAREMPAINEIDPDDFHKIMNNRLFDFWLIKHAPLIYHNESYMMLPNGLQYTRLWMIKILGEEMVETMFSFASKLNALSLTHKEHALIFPVVICFKDETLNDQETVRHIQLCYLYALYTQMLTTRTQSDAKTLFHNLLQILAGLPLLNELQEKKIGSPIPDPIFLLHLIQKYQNLSTLDSYMGDVLLFKCFDMESESW